MSFWNRKNTPQIPPVEPRSHGGDQLAPPYERGPGRSPNRSPSPNTARYGQNPNDADPYASAPPTRSIPDRYRNVGDPYARGGAGSNPDADRAELFAGYTPQPQRRTNRYDDPDHRPQNQEEEDEDVEAIKKDIRTTKQESVNSTRNALRMAREAEENARNTLQKLGEQSEKLAMTEHHLDKSKVNAGRAEDDAKKLKSLNQSIFRPSFTMNKDKKRMEQEMKVQARFEEERNAREQASQGIRDSQNRVARAMYGDDEEGIGGRRTRTEADLEARKQERKRYQFEATQSDDEMEDELDDNLDEIADVSRRLKMLATAQGDEISGQLKRLGGMGQKVDNLDSKVRSNTYKLDKIK